jgi:ABC-type dipeptide/oligopeptide/nickel transport systems, permease components
LRSGSRSSGFVVVVALVGNYFVPHDPFTQDLGNRLKPPFWMEGTSPGTCSAPISSAATIWRGSPMARAFRSDRHHDGDHVGLIGITLGVLGGFFGGRVDDAVLFAITTRLSIPVVLVALAVVGLMGSGLGLVVATLGFCCGIVLPWWRARPPCRSATSITSTPPAAPAPRRRIC